MSPTDEQVEAAAKALYGCEYDLDSYPWEGEDASSQDSYRHTARTVLTAALARPAEGDSFWVVERFEDGRSAGYWEGGSSRTFIPEIDRAIQFRRRQDAMWVIVGWHWKDVQITEHMMLSTSRPAQAEDGATRITNTKGKHP